MRDNYLDPIFIVAIGILVLVVTFISWSRDGEGFPTNPADTVQVCPTCGRAPYPSPPKIKDNQGFELDLFHLRLPKRDHKYG